MSGGSIVEMGRRYIIKGVGEFTSPEELDELITYAREKMAHFKAPRRMTFVGQLPKTATGKIQKYVLRQGAAAIAKQ